MDYKTWMTEEQIKADGVSRKILKMLPFGSSILPYHEGINKKYNTGQHAFLIRNGRTGLIVPITSVMDHNHIHQFGDWVIWRRNQRDAAIPDGT